MKVRMISALVGPTINYLPGDIVETDEAARWIEFGIAEAIIRTGKAATDAIETADAPIGKEVAARVRTKTSKVPK